MRAIVVISRTANVENATPPVTCTRNRNLRWRCSSIAAKDSPLRGLGLQCWLPAAAPCNFNDAGAVVVVVVVVVLLFLLLLLLRLLLFLLLTRCQVLSAD